MVVVIILFLVSWYFKAGALDGTDDNYILHGFLITFAAFLTLAVMSFLYQDNPFYKFAEHLFVGVSAAFWMCMGFWTTIVQNLIPRLSTTLADFFEVPQQEGGLELYFTLKL